MGQFDTKKFTGPQKVAVFLVAMGVEKAVPLLKLLPDDEVERVTIEITKLKNLPSEIVSQVVMDYYEMMLADKFVTKGGLAYAQDMLENAYGLDRAKGLLKKVKYATEVTGSNSR